MQQNQLVLFSDEEKDLEEESDRDWILEKLKTTPLGLTKLIIGMVKQLENSQRLRGIGDWLSMWRHIREGQTTSYVDVLWARNPLSTTFQFAYHVRWHTCRCCGRVIASEKLVIDVRTFDETSICFETWPWNYDLRLQ